MTEKQKPMELASVRDRNAWFDVPIGADQMERQPETIVDHAPSPALIFAFSARTAQCRMAVS